MANIPAAFLKKANSPAMPAGMGMGMPPGKAGMPSNPAAMMQQMAAMAKMMAAMGATPPAMQGMPNAMGAMGSGAVAPKMGGMPHMPGHLMQPGGAPMQPGPAPKSEEVEWIDGRPKANLTVPDGVSLGPAEIKQEETGVSIGKIPDKKDTGEELSLDEMVRLAGKRVIDAGGYTKIGYNRKQDEERGIQRGKVQVNRVINTPYMRQPPPEQPSYPGGQGSLGPMY
mmetsp:Transcript_84337/g.149078  ORF Transcript_84337/g.149078 Transcript_84337/m.149078 type:complete len:226 (+) Transcript_84337:99-776(+)